MTTANIWPDKFIYYAPSLVALAAVRSVFVDSLFIAAPIVSCCLFVWLLLCRALVSFLVLQSSRAGYFILIIFLLLSVTYIPAITQYSPISQ